MYCYQESQVHCVRWQFEKKENIFIECPKLMIELKPKSLR